jgi:hypothetical protein
MPTKHLVKTAQTLQEKLYSKAAIELANQAATRSNISVHEFSDVAQVFVACGASSQLLQLVESISNLSIEYRVRLASALSDTSDSPVIRRLLRSALVDPATDHWEFSRAASALLGPDDPRTAKEVYRAANARGPDYWAKAAVVLCKSGYIERGSDLIRTLLAGPAETNILVDVIRDLIRDQRSALVDELLTAAYLRILDCDGYQQQELVGALAKAGRTNDAITAARQAFIDNLPNGYWLGFCAQEWIEVGGATSADDMLVETLSRDVQAVRRMEVAEEFAKAGLLTPAAMMWLDVVRHHGEAIDQGVAAASCLVKCGHRDEAVATLTEALTGKQLTAPARARLRALQAWLMTA